MQFSRFSNGGFVIHKITGSFSGKVSAWFDAAGNVTDAEQIVNGRSRNVKRGGPIWNRLKIIGSAWKSKSNPPRRKTRSKARRVSKPKQYKVTVKGLRGFEVFYTRSKQSAINAAFKAFRLKSRMRKLGIKKSAIKVRRLKG